MNLCLTLENENEFDFIDTSILQRFQRNNISIEKIQKELFNFDEKGENIYFTIYRFNKILMLCFRISRR